ncbi:MAG: phosphoglucosamine mutase [Chitinophagia bacterium]|nr:phosphoglucosamine mutase [Chitinophagia bacterium]
MALIKSISGIRGTIGGRPGENLTPVDIVRFTSAFGHWLKGCSSSNTVVVGRDGRISGPLVSELVVQTLMALGLDVVDIGLSTTPTVEMAVTARGAAGGIIITASHNPKEWNALKLLNASGEFISASDGAEVLALAEAGGAVFAPVDGLGRRLPDERSMHHHIEAILSLLSHPLVRRDLVAARRFRIVVDAVNSTGAVFVPELLVALGLRQEDIIVLNGNVDGHFAHNPEPLPGNLLQLSSEVVRARADLGIAVDPDVDRLVLVCEDGSMFGEEYTLVAVADYVLGHRKGDTVSNLSSSRALRDVTEKHGGRYHAAAVGEVNVVRCMKEVSAVIGGEGNGGIIVPELHYGRDALAGIALALSHLAASGKSLAQLRRTYPDYHISKNRIELPEGLDLSAVFDRLAERYAGEELNREDGLRIEFADGWVHLRASNTEPIIRIIAEGRSETSAEHMAQRLVADIREGLHSA